MPMMIDETYLPLRIGQHRGELSSDEYESYLEVEQEQLTKRLERRERVLAIHDMTHAKPLNASQRELVGKWMKRNHRTIAAISAGTVFVVPNRLLRGVLMAIFWIQKYPGPHSFAKDYDEAYQWCVEQAEREGIELPAKLLARGLHAVNEVLSSPD